MPAQSAQNNQGTVDSTEAYIEYYGLSRDPFSPDSDFFFVTPLLEKMLRLMHYLTQFSRKIIVVTGPNGAGKTAALDQFVKPLGEEYHLCRIQALKLDTPSQVIREILHQFDVDVDETADNGELKDILTSWLEEVESDTESAVVVIDNAHLFKQPVLDMLAELAQLDAGSLHLVLCGLPVVYERLRATSSLNHREQLIYHHPLPVFSHKEVQQYVEKRFERNGDGAKNPFSQEEYLQIYQRSGGVPAQINDNARLVLVNGLDRLLNGKGMPKWMLAASAVVCVSVAVMTTAFLWQSEEQNTYAVQSGENRIAGSLSSGRINRVERQQERLSVKAEQTLEQVVLEEEEPAVGEPVAEPVPSEPIESPSQVRLMPEEALDLEEDNVVPDIEEQPISEVTPEQAELEAEPDPEPEPEQHILASELESSEPPFEPVDVVYTDSEQEILAFKATDYTLQLLGLRTERAILKLLDQVPPDANLRYFETELSGAPWFVLIYGSYTSRADAKAAAATLPKPLRPQSAWIRKLSGIQEILLQRQEN